MTKLSTDGRVVTKTMPCSRTGFIKMLRNAGEMPTELVGAQENHVQGLVPVHSADRAAE